MFKIQHLFLVSVALCAFASAKNISVDVVTPSFHDLCALVPGVTILRPNTCTNWIKCPTTADGLDLEEGSCVFGLYFNKDLGYCQYKDEMDCPYELVIETKNRCAHNPDGTFLVDESNCHGYVYCKSGQEEKSDCPNNLVFNPKSSECVYDYQYKCPKSRQMAQPNPTCMSLPNDVFFADSMDCTKYSHCLNGSLISYNCEDDKAWDYQQGICRNVSDVSCFPKAKKPAPENTVCATKDGIKLGPVSDGVSCSGYYFCKKLADGKRDRDPEHFTCTAGTFFDSQTLSCRDRLNVKCLLDRCEGMGNKYVNVAGDCKAYALCSNSVAASQGNCPDKYFFDERTQGCTPSVVNYAACSV